MEKIKEYLELCVIGSLFLLAYATVLVMNNGGEEIYYQYLEKAIENPYNMIIGKGICIFILYDFVMLTYHTIKTIIEKLKKKDSE